MHSMFTSCVDNHIIYSQFTASLLFIQLDTTCVEADYVSSAHPRVQLHPNIPKPWALDTYSTSRVYICTTVAM